MIGVEGVMIQEEKSAKKVVSAVENGGLLFGLFYISCIWLHWKFISMRLIIHCTTKSILSYCLQLCPVEEGGSIFAHSNVN